MSTKLSVLLKNKGNAIFSLSPDDTVINCVKQMSEKHIGAVLILEQDKLVGIVSERDISYKIVLEERDPKEATVSEIMTKEILTVTPSCTVEAAMQIMTGKRFRHLPVVDDGALVGLISIGDVTKHTCDTQQEHIDHLQSYINGEYS